MSSSPASSDRADAGEMPDLAKKLDEVSRRLEGQIADLRAWVLMIVGLDMVLFVMVLILLVAFLGRL